MFTSGINLDFVVIDFKQIGLFGTLKQYSILLLNQFIFLYFRFQFHKLLCDL